MKYLKYFESDSHEMYTKIEKYSLEEIFFDEFYEVTDNAIGFSKSEVSTINSHISFVCNEIIYKITEVSRKKLAPIAIGTEKHIKDEVVRIDVSIDRGNLLFRIYKTIDDWYYVNLFGYDYDYKCDQIDGLLKFIENLDEVTILYAIKNKISKKQNESKSEPDIKEKLLSIVDMCEYLWKIDAADSLCGFYGNCSTLFTGHLDVNSNWKRGEKMPYSFKIDSLIEDLSRSKYRREEKLSKIEDLYKLSLTKRFRYSKKDILKMLDPVLKFEVMGDPLIYKIDISQHYDWISTPCFFIKFFIDEDEFPYEKEEIETIYRKYRDRYHSSESESEYYKNKLDEIGDIFFKIKKIIVSTMNKLELNGIKVGNINDYTRLGIFSDFSTVFEEI